MGDLLLALAYSIFTPVVIEALIIPACFIAVIEGIEILRAVTNLKQKGGE